jgi:hypothetical protein
VAGLVEARVGAEADGEGADRDEEEENDHVGHGSIVGHLLYQGKSR